VQSYRSKRVYIDGEVKSPGLQAINDIPMTLVEAINRSGGLLPSADQSRIVLERGQQRYRVNLRDLVQKGINPGMVMLAPGDVVRVHSRDESKVFVSGEVLTPKALTMHDGRLTLNEALGRKRRHQPAERRRAPGLRGAQDVRPHPRVPARRPRGRLAGDGRVLRAAAEGHRLCGRHAAGQLEPQAEPADPGRADLGGDCDQPAMIRCHSKQEHDHEYSW
jgi:hypothetical protein